MNRTMKDITTNISRGRALPINNGKYKITRMQIIDKKTKRKIKAE